MLRDTQAAFRDAVLQGDPAAASVLVVGDRVPADRRLSIHRHNLLISLTEALAAAFPVTAERLGDDRFPVLARAFIETTPPQRPQLLAYGAAFPAFLTQVLPDPADAALPDLARLEWARVEACFAETVAPLQPERLATVPPERGPDVTFELHPSVRLVASPHPLLALWSGTNTPIGTGIVLVLWSGDTLEMAALDAGEAAFLRMVRTGMPLDVALAAAAAAEPDFDLQALLAAQFARGTFRGFSLRPA
jgi:hypothetical protein